MDLIESTITTGLPENEERAKESVRGKELLPQELLHRVKNNLQAIGSLLSLQAERLDS